MPLEPSRLADFQLLGPIGKGATSQVYDAIHRATGRPVAIKTLQIASNDDHHEIVERFAREALVVANVRSRHVGQILGFGFDRSQPFLVLERLRGETIDSLLRRERVVPVRQGLAWMAELMAGLADCHAVGVIHRDIKPANVFLVHSANEAPYAKVIDFGVARTDRGMEDLTSAQHLLGSVGYMAPEQFLSALGVGPNADIYAVGVTIFRCFSGRLPFISKNVHDVIRRKMEQEAPPLSSVPDAPRLPPLDAFLGRALARDPQVRFRTVREMLDSWGAMRRAIDAMALLGPPRPSLHEIQEEVMTSDAISVSELISVLSDPLPSAFSGPTIARSTATSDEPVTQRKPSEPPKILVPFTGEPTTQPPSETFSVPVPSFSTTAENPSLAPASATVMPPTPRIRRISATTLASAPAPSVPLPPAPRLGAAGLATLRTAPPPSAKTPTARPLREDDGPTQTYDRDELDRLVNAPEPPHDTEPPTRQ
jgi:serine/threonine-protein kinase